MAPIFAPRRQWLWRNLWQKSTFVELFEAKKIGRPNFLEALAVEPVHCSVIDRRKHQDLDLMILFHHFPPQKSLQIFQKKFPIFFFYASIFFRKKCFCGFFISNFSLSKNVLGSIFSVHNARFLHYLSIRILKITQLRLLW